MLVIKYLLRKLVSCNCYKDCSPTGPALFSCNGWMEDPNQPKASDTETATDVLWQALPVLVFLAILLAVVLFKVI